MDKIEKLQNIIDNSHNIVFFTGAGVSTDSNIPDFRSTDGLYNQKYDFPPEVILSHTFFMQNTKEFYRFYYDKMLYPDALPNYTHKFIAELEQKGKSLGVITQNIDNLHQAAGSKHVVELHGSVYRNYCTKCHKFYGLDYILKSKDIPKCDCGGIIKPDVVLYEEPLNQDVINDAINTIQKADALIVCGTSLAVYPAASFINYNTNNNLVIINKSVTTYDQNADLCINDSLSNVLTKIKIK